MITHGHSQTEVLLSRTPILGGPGLMLAIEMVVGKLGQERMQVRKLGHKEILASEMVANQRVNGSIVLVRLACIEVHGGNDEGKPVYSPQITIRVGPSGKVLILS